MKIHTKLWLTAALCFLFLQGIQTVFFNTPDWSDTLDVIDFGSNFIAELLLVLLVGWGLGWLLAILPFQNKTYKEKTPYTVPLGAIIVLSVLSCLFGYTWLIKSANGLVYSDVKLSKIQIPATLNCSEIKEGRFETETLIIERKDKVQTQTKKETGEKQTFRIVWLNDCTYILKPLDNENTTLETKIISISPERYTCYVQSASSLFRYPYRLEVGRISPQQ